MPAKAIAERAMTDAERQARYRAARATEHAKEGSGAPVIRTRRPVDHRSRARRWNDTVAELMKLQAEYDAWLQNLPETSRTPRPPKHCARSANSTSASFRQSCRRAASVAID
jgi:hypothetical protein